MTQTEKNYKDTQSNNSSKIKDKINAYKGDLSVNNIENVKDFQKKYKVHTLSGIGKINKVTNAVEIKHKSQKGEF